VKKQPRLRLVNKENEGKRATDIFDDLDKLRADVEAPTVELRPLKKVREFAQVPYDQNAELFKHRIGDAGWAVLIELDRLVFKNKENPLRLSSKRLNEMRINHNTRQRALQKLEKAGVIKMEPQGERKAPLVTYLWRRLKD
jgi:hypothetical protein